MLRNRSTIAFVFLLVVTGPTLMVTQDVAPGAPSSSLPAFPGAEGFGSTTPGGRGGRVLEVTTLANAGRGSFRACAEAEGPRICVFRTGGTIVVSRPIVIAHPDLTIAGQTAPGGGITIRSSPRYGDPTVKVVTHDVVIRGLRIRTGASMAPSPQRRSLSLERGAHDIVVDHCSLSWATDEIVTMIDGTHDVTVQWSIIAEGLSHSTHTKGEHSKAMLISGKRFHSPRGTTRISVHHDLFAHNRDRNPRNSSFGLVDVVNNVVYDWGTKATQVDDNSGRPTLNVVGNFYKSGPDKLPPFERYGVTANEASGGKVGVYVRGNLGPTRARAAEPERDIVAPVNRGSIVSRRYDAPVVGTSTAGAAFKDVLAGAGVRVPTLDPVDRRIIADVKRRTGHIIDDPSQVGGWPALATGTPPQDSDHDGMPDTWETAHGLDPTRPDGAADRDDDGYTNLEEYLNSLLVPSADPSAT
jgi:pectate lyase